MRTLILLSPFLLHCLAAETYYKIPENVKHQVGDTLVYDKKVILDSVETDFVSTHTLIDRYDSAGEETEQWRITDSTTVNSNIENVYRDRRGDILKVKSINVDSVRKEDFIRHTNVKYLGSHFRIGERIKEFQEIFSSDKWDDFPHTVYLSGGGATIYKYTNLDAVGLVNTPWGIKAAIQIKTLQEEEISYLNVTNGRRLTQTSTGVIHEILVEGFGLIEREESHDISLTYDSDSSLIGEFTHYEHLKIKSAPVVPEISDIVSYELDDSDADNDGLSSLEEVTIHGTDPNKNDTSGDGFSDGALVAKGLDPTVNYTPVVEMVQANPSDYGLFSSASIQDTNVRLGGVVLGRVGNAFQLDYTIELSEDLKTWEDYESHSIVVTPEEGKQFIRVRVGD